MDGNDNLPFLFGSRPLHSLLFIEPNGEDSVEAEGHILSQSIGYSVTRGRLTNRSECRAISR